LRASVLYRAVSRKVSQRAGACGQA